MNADVDQLLLSEDDLDDSFFGEEPSAAYDPVFISGDESGRILIDFVNGLTHGSHLGTLATASALFTSPVGNVVFHNVTKFSNGADATLYRKFIGALRECTTYELKLNDGAQFHTQKVGFDEEENVTFARWLTTQEPYRIEGTWAVSTRDGVMSFINTRNSDKSEIRRLALVALNRISTSG